jgi:hypothetical protein
MDGKPLPQQHIFHTQVFHTPYLFLPANSTSLGIHHHHLCSTWWKHGSHAMTSDLVQGRDWMELSSTFSHCGSRIPYPIVQKSIDGKNLTHMTADAFASSKGQALSSCASQDHILCYKYHLALLPGAANIPST